MLACSKGHIDIARMLVIESNANIDIIDTVRAIDCVIGFICYTVALGCYWCCVFLERFFDFIIWCICFKFLCM